MRVLLLLKAMLVHWHSALCQCTSIALSSSNTRMPAQSVVVDDGDETSIWTDLYGINIFLGIEGWWCFLGFQFSETEAFDENRKPLVFLWQDRAQEYNTIGILPELLLIKDILCEQSAEAQ